ncbi:hypothetical protein ACFYTV_25035 [Streptomyces sp. NPDC004562]|uniref:hypothetical protein n=1 Tax=Streptomyces sp. NPDC004562 TaxID=3364703 RepID=UPI00367B573C
MSGNSTTVTELTSQYSAQVTADLERNRKEQDRVADEIEALQGQLTALRHDQSVLENIQRALGAAQESVAAPERPEAERPEAEQPEAEQKEAEQKEEGEPVAVVPAPRTQEPRTTRRTKAAGAGKRTKETRPAKPAKGKSTGTGVPSRRRTGAKSAATNTGKNAGKNLGRNTGRSTAKTSAKAVEAATSSSASSPSLVELVRGHLAERQEPRSAAEVASALAERYPERGVKATVVRSTLEGLVARTQAHRSKQGRSVFYTVPDASGSSAPTTPSAPTAPSASSEQSPEEAG